MDRLEAAATIKELKEELEYYKKENARLEETNRWMHDLIWELYYKVKSVAN